MLYSIIENKVLASYEDSLYSKIRNESGLYWIDKQIPLRIFTGFDSDSMMDISEPNTYTLTYQEKLDSLRFKRGYLLQQTDCGMVTDCPLSEEQKGELATYRQSLRDITDNITEENIDTYTLPEAPSWAITWFKL